MPTLCTNNILVLIKGAGDLASGAALRLRRCGFPVVMTELAQPLMVRRTVAFGEAVYEGTTSVEGVVAQRVDDPIAALAALEDAIIPVLVDPAARCRLALHPRVLVDAVMAKRNTGTLPDDAPLVIALGPGFTAGVDCDAVIETNRGHWLGRVLWEGAAEPDTGVPGAIAGRTGERVLRAPAAGALRTWASIGQPVTAGEAVGSVDGHEIRAGIDGVLRGLLHPGLQVEAGAKIGDVDPRGEPSHCFTISDKSLAIGGGVVEAILARAAVDKL